MKFIEKIAEQIHESQQKLQNLTVVLPNERAKKYLARALFKASREPIFAPDIVTMDQWIKSYSEYPVIDNTRAIIKLFEVHLKSLKKGADDSFDEFLTWGNILISDFNEIDRYLLDATQVFKNLADIKEIEQWSFGEAELTESQKSFMQFWDNLPGFYKTLNEKLEAQRSTYSGKAYRMLAENTNLLFEINPEQHFIFAGFNALSKAEMEIIRQLEQMGRARIFIDADEYYLSNPSHEAGRFIRDFQKNLDDKKLDFVSDVLATKKMRVELIECAQNTGQVKIAATLLENSTPNEIEETLLLLADESLIGSIIKNLPKKIGKANITLGLPIRSTSAKTWVDLIFSIQENKTRFKTQALYFNDLQNFWNHPFVLAIMTDDDKTKVNTTEKNIIKHNQVFINSKSLEIGENTQKILDLVGEDWGNNWAKAMECIRSLNKLIFGQLQKEFAFEKAIIECFDKAIVEFENILIEGIPEMSLKSFKNLLNQHWGTKSIAYHGNPLDGLQIMGLLESRALDFRRIICVGMNEGHLPKTNPLQTLIPLDLRRYLGLPTPRENQGIFAHHFYRLLHHCEELFVTHCTADESIGSNEPSRYLLQLELELSRQNKNITVQKSMYMLDSRKEIMAKSIEKTPEIIARMDDILKKSTSASMLKTFITCPLDFYFKKIMDFGEEDNVEEEIENSTLGTFIHATLEELYEDFARFDKKGKKRDTAPPNLVVKDIQKMLNDFKGVLEEQFLKHFNGNKDSFMKGKNLLSYQMAIELTEKFLHSEKDFISKQTEPVFIEALEQKYESIIEIDVFGEKKTVCLKGIIDRIDSIGDKIRIIDYKSGKVNEKEVQFRSRDFDEASIVQSLKIQKHILQLVQYAYLYRAKHGVIPESSIVSFVSGQNVPFTLDTKQLQIEDILNEFPSYIGKILEEMYDESVPFEHDGSQYISYCQYCG